MIKFTKMLFVSILGVILLVSCSNNNTNPTMNPDPSSTNNTDSDSTKHIISFYNGNELYLTQAVADGECATEPEEPSIVEKEFKYWCSDEALETKYDFSTPVTSDLSLYSLFEVLPPFDNYSDKYLPVNAPFICEQKFYNGDQDIEIVLSCDSIEMNSDIALNQVSLSGGFENLTVDSIKNENGTLTISTTGTVQDKTSYIVFSRGTNDKGIYLTMPFIINEKLVPSVSIDKSSINIDFKKNDINFTIVSENQSFVQNIKEETNNYFSINDNKYELSILNINSDLKSVEAKLHSNDALNNDIINDISNNVKLNIASGALEDSIAHEISFELNVPQTSSSILVTPMREGFYSGNYRIHTIGSKLSQAFRDNILNLLNAPNNKNLFISIPDGEVTIRSINIVNDYEFTGKIEISSQSELMNATVSLNEIKVGDTTINPLVKLFSDEVATVENESIPVVVGYDFSSTGTIYQDECANYSGIKSYIQDLALEEEDTTIAELVSLGSSLGKIAYGAYSGNYSMASDGLGKVLNIDALRDPSLLMLERLQGIMDKLNEIENRIEEISEKMDDLKKELEKVGEQTVLNTFLNTYDIWISFMSNYYSPMMNEINNYTNAYYRYYYEFAMASHPDVSGSQASIDIYYDLSGNVVFPANNLIYSVDGKTIDKSKTKTIVFPELIHTLAGIRHNNGHAYTSIENDIIADLTAYQTYSDKDISDICKTLSFNAMKQYFSSQGTLDKYTNTFKNFCEALIASDIVSSVSISPLECYSILLKTIYNFGFEIEPDLNLVAIKLQTSFYASKKIFEFVKSINTGETDVDNYDLLITKVENELSSDRFYRSNDENGNVYNFVTNSYINVATNAYAIQFTLSYYDDKVARIVENDYKNIEAPELSGFESVKDEDLAFMKIKVQIYNTIKGTNYSFKGYLAKIGIIPNEIYDITKGVVTRIDGIVSGKDAASDLSFPGKIKEYYFEFIGDEPHTRSEELSSLKDFVLAYYVYAIKGEMISFDDDESYEALASFAATDMTDAYGQYNEQPIAAFCSGLDLSFFWEGYNTSVCVWSYYVAFKVVSNT